MNRALTLAAAAVLLLTLATPAATADTFKMRAGPPVEGKVVAVDHTAGTADIADAAGAVKRVRLADLDPTGYVKVMEPATAGNPARALDLARFALRNGLDDAYRRASERAGADPTLARAIAQLARERDELVAADLYADGMGLLLGLKPANALPAFERIKTEFPNTGAAALTRGAEAVHAARLGVVAPAGGERSGARPADDVTWRAALKLIRDAFASGSVDDKISALTRGATTNRPEFVDAAVTVLESTEKSIATENEARLKSDEEIRKFLGRAAFEGYYGRPEQRQEQLQALYAAHDALLARLASHTRVRDAAIRALAGLSADEAVQVLLRAALNHRSWAVRRDFAEVIGASLTQLDVSRHLDRLMADGQTPVRLAAAAAAGQRRNDLCAKLLVSALAADDQRVRFAVVAACGASGRPLCIGPLIARLRKGAGESPAMHRAIDAALKLLTGLTFASDLTLWERWWKDHQAEVEGGAFVPKVSLDGPAAFAPNAASFYGVPIDSLRLIFVIDVSGSMQTPAEWHDPGETRAPGSAGPTRMEVAKRELRRAIEKLPREARFNVVSFSTESKVMHQRGSPLAEAEPGVVKQTLREIDLYVADGATSAYGALSRAWDLAKESWKDARKEAGADTVFFLTDGEPTDAMPDDILRAVARWQVDLSMKVHCIDIGSQGEAFLRPLAERNGGRYVAR